MYSVSAKKRTLEVTSVEFGSMSMSTSAFFASGLEEIAQILKLFQVHPSWGIPNTHRRITANEAHTRIRRGIKAVQVHKIFEMQHLL